MASSVPTTPASPNVFKLKAPEPGVPVYGCEHLQRLFSQSSDVTNMTIKFYKMLLRVIFDNTPIVPQTSKAPHETAVTSLTANYLCLQCSVTALEKDRNVDSRSGSLFCQMCDDFVWDPMLEELRLRKIGSGTFSSRKRKHDELFTDAIKDDPKNPPATMVEQSCRTSGLRGIYNMGATCFMSVILQSFIHNPLLRNFFLGDGHRAGICVRENCLSCAMDEMFQDFYSQDTTAGYSASNLLSSSWASKSAAFTTLAGYDEQDAHEFFQFLVEELHRTKRYLAQDEPKEEEDGAPQSHGQNCHCIVHQAFYGKLQSTVTCQNCMGMTTSVEPFLDLSLAVDMIRRKQNAKNPKKQLPLTLQRCLDEEYMRPEWCEYRCLKCNTQDARKQVCIKRLPNVLCIQFKRFEHNKEAGLTSKINNQVQFPLQLNMLPYTNRARSQDLRESFELARSCTYDLLSVIVHVGSLDTGHYICYSRVGSQWFLFDDHKVTLATESQVLGAEAFLLFYIIRSLA